MENIIAGTAGHIDHGEFGWLALGQLPKPWRASNM
jgi:hypothetical protein